MISVLGCDRKKDEVESLREDCRHRIAKSSDEKLDFSVASGDEDLQDAPGPGTPHASAGLFPALTIIVEEGIIPSILRRS